MHNKQVLVKELPVRGWSHRAKFIRFILRD